MPLEDDFSDIIKKARIGQGLSVAEVARTSGLPLHEITNLEGGRAPDHAQVEVLAQTLGLRSEALATIAFNGWAPAPPVPSRTPYLETIVGDIGGYAVKGYVLYDAEASEAILIDTGYNPEEVLAFLERRGLGLTGVGLTHGHRDHAGGLDHILKQWPVPVYLGVEDYALLDRKPLKERLMLVSRDDSVMLRVGRFRIRLMAMPGHTPGGLCYRVESGDEPACFVGDTLFAGSIGRANPPSLYPIHLVSVHRLLTLPPATRLFPGHGPGTTVAEELEHNPFA